MQTYAELVQELITCRQELDQREIQAIAYRSKHRQELAQLQKENRQLIANNEELFEVLKQTCQQLHDTRKKFLSGY